MDIIYLGSPKEHHKFLEHLPKAKNKYILVRLDNHPDNTLPGPYLFALEYSTFMNYVINGEYFKKIIWINKKSTFMLNINYSKESRYENMGELLADLESLIKDESIFIDIDPDVLHDYKTGFSKGGMEDKELGKMVRYIGQISDVKQISIASTPEMMGWLIPLSTCSLHSE